MENQRTLVIAEQKLEGDGLVAILKNIEWVYLISESVAINTVSEKFGDTETDLIVINMNYGNEEFMEHFYMLKNCFPTTKFFIIALSQNTSLISNLLKFGISGYFLKASCQEKLINALECVMNNEIFLSEDISKIMLQTLFAQNKNGNNCKDSNCLTKREHDIFRLIINAESSSQIANELYISEHTVNTHRKHILKKMGFNSTASLIKYAIQNGII